MHVMSTFEKKQTVQNVTYVHFWKNEIRKNIFCVYFSWLVQHADDCVPIVGLFFRQSSEKFFAIRRKNLVSFVSMGYTKERIGVKMVSAFSPSAASKIKSFSDSFPGGSVTAAVLLKRLARLILSASLHCCTVRRFSFRLRSYTHGLSHNRSCLF